MTTSSKKFTLFILLKINKLLTGTLVLLVASSIFTVSAFARKGNWKNPRPIKTPIIVPAVSPSQSPRPTTTPTAKPVTPSPTPLKPTFTPSSQPPGNSLNVYVTLYGWSDNDPPGTAIAYPKSDGYPTIHNGAGGNGTYSDPVTFAANPKAFSPGMLIYIPYIKKYAMMEDSCASCTGNWIDVWAGGNGQNEAKLIACEENLTRDSEKIILNPASNLEVNTSPLFNSATAQCVF